MLSRTHMAVGLAAGIAMFPPQSPQELLLTAGAASIGAVISDIDSKGSDSYKGAARALGLMFFAAGAIAAADYFSGRHLYRELFGRFGVYDFASNTPGENLRVAVSFAAFLLWCLVGMLQKHRAFTHSLTACALLTGSVYGFLPWAAAPFGVGMLTHITLDLLNKKRVRLFWPFGKGVSLGFCDSDGLVNTLFAIAGIAVASILIYIRASELMWF